MAEIRIRPADLEADRPLLVELLLKHLTTLSTDRRFHWFYHENPHGQGQAWIATHGQEGQVIGSGSVIPQLVYVQGVLRRAAVLADFWVHPDFRSLGPAIKLQQACIRGAAETGFAFFDMPQRSMSAVYKRMKLLGNLQLSGLAKPLRTEPYLLKLTPRKWIVRPLAVLGDLWLKRRDSGLRSDCEISVHDGAIGEEFSDLSRRASTHYGICVARDADYVAWRYRRHYHVTYEIFTARRSNRLVAYAAVMDTGSYAEVVDLFGEYDPTTLKDLLSTIAREFRRRGRDTLRIALYAPTQWLDLLTSAGFRRRQLKPIVVHAFESVVGHTLARAWFLTYGDMDY